MDRGLTYTHFVDLLDQVAHNCLYTSKSAYGAVSRVRTMFHAMNSSRGRMKLAKDTNASIIPPLTGLDSTDPTLYKPAGAMPARKNRRAVATRRTMSQSPVNPPGNRRRLLEQKSSSSEPSTPDYASGSNPASPGLSTGMSKHSSGLNSGRGSWSRASSSSSKASNSHRANGKPDWV